MVAVDTMLESGLQFDAVFALNDLLAWGVLRELRERGVAVPDDVRVIGFDDVEESAYMVPSLSTVNPGREAIARLAVGLRLMNPWFEISEVNDKARQSYGD